MKKFSKKRLIAFLKWEANCLEEAFKDPETPPNRKSTLAWELIETKVLINYIETWEITELNYGREIDKFL